MFAASGTGTLGKYPVANTCGYSSYTQFDLHFSEILKTSHVDCRILGRLGTTRGTSQGWRRYVHLDRRMLGVSRYLSSVLSRAHRPRTPQRDHIPLQSTRKPIPRTVVRAPRPRGQFGSSKSHRRYWPYLFEAI